MKQYYLGRATIDANGKATLSAPVPPGSYFVFSGGRNATNGLVWDVPVNLTGHNDALILKTENAEAIP